MILRCWKCPQEWKWLSRQVAAVSLTPSLWILTDFSYFWALTPITIWTINRKTQNKKLTVSQFSFAVPANDFNYEHNTTAIASYRLNTKRITVGKKSEPQKISLFKLISLLVLNFTFTREQTHYLMCICLQNTFLISFTSFSSYLSK